MKMKKTQSLKLMLLGLFSLVSTGVWAQFTQVNGVVYDVRGDKAKVVGVLSALPDGAYGDGRYLPGTKSIQIEDAVDGKKVDGLAANWMNSGEFANTTTGTLSGNVTNTVTNADGTQTVTVSNGGGSTQTTVYPTIDATTLAAVELLFKASEITEISRSDFKGLKVAGFILGSTSGITEIPENLFASTKTILVEDEEAYQAYLKEKSDAYLGYDTYAVEDGKFNGKQVYKTTDGKYLVVDETIVKQQGPGEGEFVFAAKELKDDFSGTKDEIYAYVRTNDNGNLVKWENNAWVQVATPYEGENLGKTHHKGSKALAEDAAAALTTAETAYNNAKQKTIDLASYIDHPELQYTQEEAEQSAKAKALLDAINAFQSDATKWNALRQHIASSTGVNPTLVDAWYAAYVLANNALTDLPTVDAADQAYIADGNKVPNFRSAYTAYFGLDAQPLQQTEVLGYNFTSFAAAGNIFHNVAAEAATSLNLHQLATGIVEDRSTDIADPDKTVTFEDKTYYKVKVLQNSVDAANWEGKAFYVQLPEDKFIVTDTYYVLYEYKNVEGEMKMMPVTFQTQVVTSITPGQETSEEVQVVVTYDEANKVMRATFPNEETLLLTLKTDKKNKLENCTVKVGEEYKSVTHSFKVTEEGDNWNGWYFIGTEGELYKQTAEGDILWLNHEDMLYKEATAITMTKTTPATPTENTTTETATIVVNINPIPDTYEYTLSPKDAKTTIDDADPREQLGTEIINYGTRDGRVSDYNDAVADEAAKKIAYDNAVTTNSSAASTAGSDKTAYEAALNADKDVPIDVYDKDGKNEDLYQGTFYNDIVTVGARAFANCKNAKFTGTFKNNLVEIGKEAFLNTLFENLDLSNTGKKDWRGGNPDEDGNPTPDGKTDIKDRLTGDDIAVDAFVGTPMVSMNLSNTNVGDKWVYSVVRNIKFEEPNTVEYTDACGNTETYDMPVNKTLTTVVLPTGEGEDELDFDRIQGRANSNIIGTFENCIKLVAIDIPAQVYQIEPYAFNNCVALATITFATEKAELQRIGRNAFYGTAAATIDLSKQTLLGVTTVPATAQWAEQAWSVPVGIGDFAFAAMPNLTSVNFTNTQLTTLPVNVFLGSVNLQTVTFFNAADPKSESLIATLPAGLFKTNFAITALDLSKTEITTLENLFQARPEKTTVIDCAGNETQKGLWNEALTSFTLPENLEKIMPFALSSLWGLTYSKADPFIIPSSVKEIGEGAFMNDKNLVAVKAMDSELTALPQSAFAQCSSLEEVTLVTVNTLMPGFFGDKCFFSTKDPDVYVNNDTYKLLGENFFEGSYAILKPYASVINTNKIGSLYYKPWTSKYGAWIEATEHVGVYTAYQNGSKISLYPAKKSTFVIDGVKKDYYKIAAYDKDAYEDSRMIIEYGAPYQIDYLLNARMTFDRKAQYGEGLPDDIPTGGASYIDSYYSYLFNEEFDADEWEKMFSKNFSNEVRAKTWLALGTAIIVSDQADAIPYLQKTNPWQKYQSTLDLANQLIVATEDIPADNNTNFYYLAEQDGKPKFIHHNDETVLEFIPEEAVAFMMDADFGHMGMSRDFFDIEFISENGATAINGVVERSINDGEAIYNLQGVKVAAPKKGQLYIQGGKTFIQK